MTVTIRVGHGSIGVVERMVDDTEFDADVGADLRNRLVGATPLPVRHYRVRVGAETSVEVEETADDTLLWLEIEGGDHNGEWLPFKASANSYRVGRGPWHGPNNTLTNELVVSDHDTFVSRRAALLRRAGASLEIESLDQEDCLVVVHADGKRVRPTHVPSRRVRVGAGDTLELNNGGHLAVRLHLHRRRPDQQE